MALVYRVPDDDPDMQRAVEQARATFRYFWRELSWEYRRIVPGLDLAAIKVPFTDPPDVQGPEGANAEQMWLNEITFDGREIKGTLLNSPQWLTSIKEGDEATVPISGISDWMYAINERVYGAYTVNLIRSQMSRSERSQHDSAWGLNFGDPNQIELMPAEWFGKKSGGGFFSKLFGGGGASAPTPLELETTEHPMAANMADSLEEFLDNDPSNVHSKDDLGFTLLHQQTMAGTAIGVSILLKRGADPNAVTDNGLTPLQLANTLGWKQVAETLIAHGAK